MKIIPLKELEIPPKGSQFGYRVKTEPDVDRRFQRLKCRLIGHNRRRHAAARKKAESDAKSKNLNEMADLLEDL